MYVTHNVQSVPHMGYVGKARCTSQPRGSSSCIASIFNAWKGDNNLANYVFFNISWSILYFFRYAWY